MSECKNCKKKIRGSLFCSSLCVTYFAEKYDKLKSELEALRATEDCTSQEIIIKSLREDVRVLEKSLKMFSLQSKDCRTAQEIEIKALKGFLNDIANHDWDLSEMGAEEIYRGACELEKKLYHIPDTGNPTNKGRL